MAERLPLRKYIKVWIKKRKNNPMKTGRRTTSYTLEWVEYSKRRFMSLGKHASLQFARQMAAIKESELNSIEESQSLEPIIWLDFCDKYLETIYPGHNLPAEERKVRAQKWGKSVKSMLREKLAMKSFGRICKPRWCHEITAEDREKFIVSRLDEVQSAQSVDTELRVLRLLCNLMQDWRHRPDNSNPFSGRGKATVGVRRKRQKHQQNKQNEKPGYYTMDQLVALLNQADHDVEINPENWKLKRLRALVYIAAYTGARINEILHLEWADIDWENGVAFLYFKIENDLKTEDSAAPFGLPDALVEVLREWNRDQTCSWIFPNAKGKPWVTGGPGYKPLDQLKKLAQRAGIEHATWKMFRHSFDTHGKLRFGMTQEQMRVHLRHTTLNTQKYYDHADLQNLRDAVKNIDFRVVE